MTLWEKVFACVVLVLAFGSLIGAMISSAYYNRKFQRGKDRGALR